MRTQKQIDAHIKTILGLLVLSGIMLGIHWLSVSGMGTALLLLAAIALMYFCVYRVVNSETMDALVRFLRQKWAGYATETRVFTTKCWYLMYLCDTHEWIVLEHDSSRTNARKPYADQYFDNEPDAELECARRNCEIDLNRKINEFKK